MKRSTQILEVDQIVNGSVNYSELTGGYAFTKIKAGFKGVDWEKAFLALNMMTEHDWEYRNWIVAGMLAGYLMERE
jgi:hypothetical protein